MQFVMMQFLLHSAFMKLQCIHEALRDEIKWPTMEEQDTFGTHIFDFLSCIELIDGTLIKIRNDTHRFWFNGCQKMHCMNNMIVFDHHGLFVYFDTSSFHV